MTSFFDELSHEVGRIKDEGDAFLSKVETIESRVVQVVNVVTGDREFPEDAREHIQGVIARYQVADIGHVRNARAREEVEAMHMSLLIEGLHGAFHSLARRRIECRFGQLTDSPKDILVQRDDHDGTDLATEHCW